jgi:hypothetical protein
MTREVCKRCFRESAVGFSVPDDVWAAVKARALPHAGNVLCLACFTEAGDELRIKWDRDIQFWPVSRVTHEGVM